MVSQLSGFFAVIDLTNVLKGVNFGINKFADLTNEG